MSRTHSSSRTPPRPTHYLATPPPEDHDDDSNAAWLPRTQPSQTEYFHTPMVADEDEFERMNLPSKSGMPPLTRQTTYSSLPPSPRYEDYDFAGKVDIKEFEEALGRIGKGGLRRSSVSASAVPRSLSVNDMLSGGGSGGGAGKSEETEEDAGVSMWDLLKDEVGVEDWDGWIVDGKWERIANFLAVPLAVEKVRPLVIDLILQANFQVTLFGALLCLDGFLYNFTILPIRSIFATARIASNAIARRPILPIPPTHLLSILRMLLLFIPTVILLVATDASKMYHTVRGQDTIKLYVIFNALEVSLLFQIMFSPSKADGRSPIDCVVLSDKMS